MREIVMDTETTGLDPFSGDRIVEIGAVELWNHLPTGKTFHQYINPERDMPDAAFAVHGLSAQFLSDKPKFIEVAHGFVDFVQDSQMVIHNASFDMKFLNAELVWANMEKLPMKQALDTLEIARRRFPGAQNSLDALCRRFGINTARELHGALLDSEILAEVYLELVGGRQPDFALGIVGGTDTKTTETTGDFDVSARSKKLPPRITEAEEKAHSDFIEGLGPNAIWKN